MLEEVNTYLASRGNDPIEVPGITYEGIIKEHERTGGAPVSGSTLDEKVRRFFYNGRAEDSDLQREEDTGDSAAENSAAENSAAENSAAENSAAENSAAENSAGKESAKIESNESESGNNEWIDKFIDATKEEEGSTTIDLNEIIAEETKTGIEDFSLGEIEDKDNPEETKTENEQTGANQMIDIFGSSDPIFILETFPADNLL